jgi:hypothetical protein
MAFRDRAGFQFGINYYVPGMAYSSAMALNVSNPFSLGTPAAVSANNIVAAANAQATVGALTAITLFTLDSPYGRSLRLTPSGDPGNSAAIDILGRDYLGQPMSERFTGASGSTAILYGKKAFKYITGWKVATAATNAVTWAVGTGWFLGLPFKGDIEWAKEGGVYVPLNKRDVILSVDRDAANATAGGSYTVRSPCAGFVKNVFGTTVGVGGGGANPVLTVKLGGTAITGLTATLVDNSANTVTGVPTTAGYNANNRLRNGDRIEILGSASASAGPDNIGVTVTPTQFALPDYTDPQTNTTGDPRGTYDANLAAYDGSTEIIVGLLGDASVNSSGNGGLYGIKHITV